MENNINQKKKKAENEPSGLENEKDKLEEVIGDNRKKEAKLTEKFNDLSSEIEEKIPEAFGLSSSLEKKKVVEEEEMMKKEADEAKDEYEQMINDISKERINLGAGSEVEDSPEKNIRYDNLALAEQTSLFRDRVKKIIKNKAEELGMSEEILINLAELDLESLDPIKLDKLNLKQGEFDFIEASIVESINQFEKSDDPKKLTKEGPSSIDEIVEFTNKHNKKVGMGMLLLYLSSFGIPVMEALAKTDASVDVYGEKVSIRDLMDNPELMKNIDRVKNLNSPIGIKAVYEPLGGFEYGNSVKFSFLVNAKVDNDNKIKRSIYFGDILGPVKSLENMNKELGEIGISLVGGKESSMDDFISKKDQIAEIVSKNLGVPIEEISEYLNEYIEPNVSVSDVKVVELEDFKISREQAQKPILQQKKSEVYEKYRVDSEMGRNPESWLKAEKELEQWWKNNGDISKSFDRALEEEKEKIENSPEEKLKSLKYHEIETSMFKNADEFRALTIKSLSDAGYSIPELKKIAQDNPEKVIKIMAEVINKNVDYDWLEYLNIEVNDVIGKLIGEEFQINYFMDKKHEEGISKETLKSGKGVCHDIGETFVAMKYILEMEGVPNLDKFASLWTVSSAQNHLWPVLVTIEHDKADESKTKLVISYIDPTWSDFDGKSLDANDKEHFFTMDKKEVDEAQKEILDAIDRHNKFIRQEKIREDLMMYNPDLKKIGIQYVKTKNESR